MQTFMTRTSVNVFPFSELPPIDYSSHEATVASLEARKSYARNKAAAVTAKAAEVEVVKFAAAKKAPSLQACQRREKVGALILAGKSVADVVYELRVSNSTVRLDCVFLVIKAAECGLYPKSGESAFYRKCAAKGMTKSEAARARGVSRSSLTIWAKANPDCKFVRSKHGPNETT